MLKKLCALLFYSSSMLATCPQFATIKDLRKMMNSPYYGCTMELQRQMRSLNNDYKGIPMQREYLINQYHRLTEELSILEAKLKAAGPEYAKRGVIILAIRKKDKEILSLKQSYLKECGTSDIDEHARPVLEALDKLQNTKQYAALKQTLAQDFRNSLSEKK